MSEKSVGKIDAEAVKEIIIFKAIIYNLLYFMQ